MLKDLLLKNRSYRRFVQSEPIPRPLLEQWVDNVRYCASSRNIQALRYKLVCDEELKSAVFPCLSWAGYLKDWAGPEEGERPAAYIIQLLDKDLTANPMCDEGLQIQTLMLSAVEAGYGGCIIKAFDNAALRRILQLPEHLQICYVLALGLPAEKVVVEPLPADGDIKYWRGADGTHHVPKRPLNEILL